jgi:hypothetical protein
MHRWRTPMDGWAKPAGWHMKRLSRSSELKLKGNRTRRLATESHLELGMAALNHDWDWQTQKREFERALAINKNSTAVHWAYASYLIRVGNMKGGIAEAKTAMLLDPISSRSFMNLAFDYYYGRQCDMALERCATRRSWKPTHRSCDFRSASSTLKSLVERGYPGVPEAG